MTSELQHLKQKIRRLEAGGEPNLALRREYNAKLQAHRNGAAHLSGGGAVIKFKEFRDKVLKKLRQVTENKKRLDVVDADIQVLNTNDKHQVKELERLEKSLTETVKSLRTLNKMVLQISGNTDSDNE